MTRSVRERVNLLLEEKSADRLGREIDALQRWVKTASGGVELSDAETMQAYLDLLDFTDKIVTKRQQDWDKEIRRRGDVFYNQSLQVKKSDLAKRGSPRPS